MNRFRKVANLIPATGTLAAVFLLALAAHGHAGSGDVSRLSPRDRDSLRRFARDTWHSFEAMAGISDLPADALRRGKDGAWGPTRVTTPTDIGAYLWSTLAAERLGLIEAADARRRIDRTLAAIARLERQHGLFLDKLDPRPGARLENSPEGGPGARRRRATQWETTGQRKPAGRRILEGTAERSPARWSRDAACLVPRAAVRPM